MVFSCCGFKHILTRFSFRLRVKCEIIQTYVRISPLQNYSHDPFTVPGVVIYAFLPASFWIKHLFTAVLKIERHLPAEALKVSDTPGLRGFLHPVLKVNIRNDSPRLSHISTFRTVFLREDVCNDSSNFKQNAHVCCFGIHDLIPGNLVSAPAPLPKRTNRRMLPKGEESRNVAATALG